MASIFFVGDARDYHAMDWYHTVKEVCDSQRVAFVTDLVCSEGCQRLIRDDDDITELLRIDRLLLPGQSRLGNIWRNLVKLAFFPLQARRLRAVARDNPGSVFHAHTMYYMFLCWIAGIHCIGTPQGSEILVRPNRSRLYRHFAIRSLLAARHVTVDSVNMQNRIRELCGRESTVVQNGIDVDAILRVVREVRTREHVVSIRGFTPLYRIAEILDGREQSRREPRLHLIYPFKEDGYKTAVTQRFKQGDRDLGRLPRAKMYEMLTAAKLAISIPMSDSSPRSVYEAIFCGCCVAVTYNPWIEALPDCMRARLFIVDLADGRWLDKALEYADAVTQVAYTPSEEALNMFDQRRSMQIVAAKFY
ncbi:MAG: glycosyltransferase [Sedimentisphaerales bacterium]|nr:glycosyltransferase [Sedimentisphaerales bacterium]